MKGPFLNPLTNQITGFLNEIGLPVRLGAVPLETFLPGIHVENGVLVVEEGRLLYPGDLLHEAGHLAVSPSALRGSLSGNTGDDPGGEMAAIAWSYAAALHLKLDLTVVFHPAGYRGGSQAIITNFSQRRYVGVPLLVWMNLTDERYPAMMRWLRD
ncbi:MAG TPA: hypothetical protein VKB88_06615 [Bryobacteraceae bacterium]|nr:hypothetical protein [Bryobacteraceae bacterium]